MKKNEIIFFVSLRQSISQLAGLLDLHNSGGLAALRSNGLDALDHVHALQHLAEHDVLAVQPVSGSNADEELRAVRVGASVGHRQGAGAEVLAALASERLILELAAVDRLAASAVEVGEVASLAHEALDHTVEDAAGIAEALLAGAQSAEVLSGLGARISEQLHRHAASWRAADGQVEEHLGVRWDHCVEG
eukprot:CAMPEP_0176432520 /NCGR_PEP_ID=MMETSP0127-20121128/15443_1 /TAXON_ID=938130 /ORGANISM="Platyophrya macrostoma, Strain WH" /LENGTH=190 /DNA_ID=CAMNT_0017814707 /DNA_START=85 /DNA_END=655 /DNA_ORIENTATION=-